MSRLSAIRPEFVEYVPKDLEEGVLYISIPYRTAVHRCACGCGSRITTPIRPHQWRLTYDGETVSLKPSIGNWSYPCQSHYWIERNVISWSKKLSNEKIAAVRERDKADREKYYRGRHDHEAKEAPITATPEPPTREGLVAAVWRRLTH
jgi:hypothetical protein